MPFVIRSQGFMYNDEYNEPSGHLLTLVRRIYATRDLAEEVLERLHREWLRNAPALDDHLWGASDADVAAVHALFQRLFPDEPIGDRRELAVPADATDDELDEIVRVAGVAVAEIHEIGADEGLPDEEEAEDELDYGSPALYAALTRYEPTGWPPAAPTGARLAAAPPAVQVAWDWVASQPEGSAVPRSEARARARSLGLDWHEDTHRALVAYAPEVEPVAAFLACSRGDGEG